MHFTYPLWVNLLAAGIAVSFLFVRFPGHKYEQLYRKLCILGGIGTLFNHLPPVIHAFHPLGKDTQGVLKDVALWINFAVVVAIVLLFCRERRKRTTAEERTLR